MTQNQINFARLREDIAHNREMERQGIYSITEAIRHNQVGESINWFDADTRSRIGESTIEENKARAKYANTQSTYYPMYILTQNKNPVISGAGGVLSLIPTVGNMLDRGFSSIRDSSRKDFGYSSNQK